MKGFSKKANTSNNEEVKQSKPFVPTEEQEKGKDLVIKEKMVKFGAPAGSGKSSSLYYFGRENPVPSLGLVFNKTMALEAQAKSPHNITWKTTHSLAYARFGSSLQGKLSRPRGRYVNVAMTGSEIAMYYRLPDFFMGEEGEYISKSYVGLIIKDTVNSFEVSADQELERSHVGYHHIKVLQKRYGDIFPKKKFVNLILRKAKDLWEERKDLYSDVMCTHNTYLKLFQLSNPDLSKYKVIYVDESQDLNPVTINIILQQKDRCKIVWIGDKYQSIYQFNGAVNAMATIDCASSYLTKSFRFGEKIAKVAHTILRGKLRIVGNETLDSKVSVDLSVIDTKQPYTILFRTNMELIYQSVKLITAGESVNVNTDLKDFVAMVKSAEALYTGEMKKIKHENILPFTKWEDLVEEGKAERELKRIASIVENGQAEEIIATLHEHDNKANAHITLTSAHKSKGLEWKQVILGNDFPSNYDHKGRFIGLSEQEENLLYVASTRAEMALQYNDTVQELLDLDNIDLEEKQLTDNLVTELNKVDGIQSINMQSEGGAEQAGYELESVMEHENQRDIYANGGMSEEQAFEQGIIDSSGCITENVDNFTDRIKIDTKESLDCEIEKYANYL